MIRLFAGLLASLICFAIVVPAAAQHDAPPINTPAPPAGEGRLTIDVSHPTDASAIAGLKIVLYSLAPDGRPGFARGTTDANGRFVFENLSNEEGIIYLAGVRHHEIPFGERASFGPGETETAVTIRLSDPTDDVAHVVAEELRVRIDWMGDRLRVREILRLRNESDRVILVAPDGGQNAIAERPLGTDVQDFSQGTSSIGEDLTFEAGRARYWGPLYPGEQRVEYEYTLPITSPEKAVVDLALREAVARLVVVAGTPGITISGSGLIQSSSVQSDTGQPLAAWARSGLSAGESFALDLSLPQVRREASLLTIAREDLWLEMDDTQLTARVSISLVVPPGSPLAGTPEAPLMQVKIPAGASLDGVDPKAEALGLLPRGDGGFNLIGPLAPGQTEIGYAFRMPTTTTENTPASLKLNLEFPADVSTLNVLIADTGIALDSSRLHRRRPFRSGKRNFLHREAYNVSPNEVVDLELELLSDTGLPRSATTALTLAAAVAGALFLMTPLRQATRRIDPVEEQTPTSLEREAIYASIRDLDHDFETGKLEEGDYERLRSEMRSRAIALLRTERSAQPSQELAPETTPAASSATSEPEANAFCPQCGGAAQPEWHFCTHCGGPLPPAKGTLG